MLSTGCSKSTQDEEDIRVELDEFSEELDGFLPGKGFTWIYNGFAEYVQKMSVTDIYVTNSKKIYKVSGEVLDMSSGESSLDFSLTINYMVDYDSIVQEKIEEVMMDSEYDRITLLKLPIEEGATWTEKVTSSDGKKDEIEATMVEVIGNKPSRTIRIEYKSKNGGYTEKRSIQEGIGVVKFDKSVNYGDEKFDLGYTLFKYDFDVNSTNIVATDNVSNKATETIETTTVSDGTEGIIKISEEDLVRHAIKDFNNAWVDYVNEGKTEILSYLVKNSPAYQVIENFKAGTMKQKFNKMETGKVSIDGDEADIEVHEEILKMVDNNTETLVYDWIYHLKKIEGKWLIEYYEKNEN